jgi:large subunit ribosomal protein L29
MKASKLSGMDTVELERQAQDAQEQLFRLRFQMGMGQFEGLKKYRHLRKDRARLLTVLNQKRAPETAPAEASKAEPVKAKKAKSSKG